MLINGVECQSGWITYQDIVQNLEMWCLKKYHNDIPNVAVKHYVVAHAEDALKISR